MTEPTTPLPDGYYAVLDPDRPATMTYWRARDGVLRPWPAKAHYGPPRLLKRDAPTDQTAKATWMRTWIDGYRAWHQRVGDAIRCDRDACRARFAAFAIRCADCGRPLTDATSKTFGIGPECRRGYSEAWLAEHFTPLVATAHAQHTAEEPTR
jgi:hypothetical protein